ncbi:MAG: DUF308 domain-containing protein [Bacilli bacterium]|nr:DUF308 domain-containing protein [Bacilli bacterium]
MSEKRTKAVKVNKNKPSVGSIFTALAFILIGIMMCIFRGESMTIGIMIIGGIVLAYGIANIVAKNVVMGIILTVIGALVLFGGFGSTMLTIMTVFLGVCLIVRGAYAITFGFKTGSVFGFLMGGLTIVVGILLIIDPWVTSEILPIIIGVTFIIDGFVALFNK